MQRKLKAVVRSTLPGARAQSVTVEWTVQDGEVREPVTGEARTGEADTEPGVLTTSVNEADGVNAGDIAEGGEPSESARRARQAVRSRSGAADSPRRAAGAAVKLLGDDRDHRHVDWRRRRRHHQNGADIAVMVGSVVNMNGVTGNEDNAKPPTTRT